MASRGSTALRVAGTHDGKPSFQGEKNFILSPHIGGVTSDAYVNMGVGTARTCWPCWPAAPWRPEHRFLPQQYTVPMPARAEAWYGIGTSETSNMIKFSKQIGR